MTNCVVLNALHLSPYALEPVFNGKSALELAVEFGNECPGADKVLLFSDSADLEFQGTQTIVLQENTVSSFIEKLAEISASFDTVIYAYADCPLLDIHVTRSMYENHIRYFAEYTFSDGYPEGLTPEIISSAAVLALKKLAEKETGPVARTSIFEIIQKDINAFEIETYLSPEDLRLLRLNLCCRNKRDFLQTKSIYEKGGIDCPSIISLLQQDQSMLRTVPAYIQVQITQGCPQSCAYCPYPVIQPDLLNIRDAMPVDKFKDIILQAAEFCGEAVIGLSLWGEPSFHPEIVEIVGEVVRTPGLSLVIETSGIGWQDTVIEELSTMDTQARLDWIVSLDAISEEGYERLRGPGYREAIGFTKKISQLFPGHVYPQAVRMKENEPEVEEFFRYWKEETGDLIIQKYDHFCGMLPEKKVADLSPLNRFPCWHIKRDMIVLIDGSVSICKEDLRKEHVLGNMFTDSFESIWKNGEEYYKKHLAEDYPKICLECDEYYTYNF
ncbi:MAG: spiro-SPASM protein [Spirochaetia bacterium]